MLKKGLYMLPTGKIVALERVEIYENVLNEATGKYTDMAALVTWVDEKGSFPRTLIMGDQFKSFYRLGGL